MNQIDFKPSPLADVARKIGEDSAMLIFTRTLPHPPSKVWRALTEPNEQLEWLPFVADRALDVLGPVQLRMTDGNDAASTGEVLQCDRPRLLQYRWGEELLTWELAPQGVGTLLTLRHTTKMPDRLSSFAAGWHICLDVAERFMDGQPVGRIVGSKAIEFGWAELNDRYRDKLKVVS